MIKKTPKDWAIKQGIAIIDKSGWKKNNWYDGVKKDFKEPIELLEFNARRSEHNIKEMSQNLEHNYELFNENRILKERVENLEDMLAEYVDELEFM